MSLNTDREAPNQEDFIEQFVLFIHPDDVNSQQAISIVDNNRLPSIKIQNICTIPQKFLPQFVNGVPTLVDTKEKTVLKGTQCLQQLNVLAQDTINGASSDLGKGRPLSTLDSTLRFKTKEQTQNESKLTQCKSVAEFEKMREAMLTKKPNVNDERDQIVPIVV